MATAAASTQIYRAAVRLALLRLCLVAWQLESKCFLLWPQPKRL